MKRVSVKANGLSAVIPAAISIAQPNAGKRKVLFSIPDGLATELDVVWFELRNKYRGKRNVDKSEMVSLALKQLLDDYKAKKDGSLISKSLDIGI
jgi:hypothetical protein